MLLQAHLTEEQVQLIKDAANEADDAMCLWDDYAEVWYEPRQVSGPKQARPARPRPASMDLDLDPGLHRLRSGGVTAAAAAACASRSAPCPASPSEPRAHPPAPHPADSGPVPLCAPTRALLYPTSPPPPAAWPVH